MEVLKSLFSFLLAIVVVLLFVGVGIVAFLVTASFVPFILGFGVVIVVAATIYNSLFNKD